MLSVSIAEKIISENIHIIPSKTSAIWLICSGVAGSRIITIMAQRLMYLPGPGDLFHKLLLPPRGFGGSQAGRRR